MTVYSSLFSLFLCSAVWMLQCFTPVYGCKQLQIRSDQFDNYVFQVNSQSVTREAGITTGRASYRTTATEAPIYLFHIVLEDGTGRWVIDPTLGNRESGMAYVDSWAVAPNLIHAVNENDAAKWTLFDGNSWEKDGSFFLYCVEDSSDQSIYLDITEGDNYLLSGFYVEVANENDNVYNGPLLSRIGMENEDQLYLFKFGEKWLIGLHPGEDSALSFVHDTAPVATEISSNEWYFAEEKSWKSAFTHVLKNSPELNIYGKLRDHRRLKFLPENQKGIEMRNHLVMPALGLGTGKIYAEELPSILDYSLRNGFRLLDSAREYHNERIIGEYLASHATEPEVPLRQEVFVVTKVWPTHFGFYETLSEVYASLRELKSNYVDLYLLHWPACYPEVSWMHCEDTINKEATYRESWRALERAYAEGLVMSIGVSNFELNALNDLETIAHVHPHAVQNYARPGAVDLDVRIWCSDHETVYMPYGSINSLETLPAEVKQSLESAAKSAGKSKEVVAAKFMLQSGTAIIPRSTKKEHLDELLALFSWELPGSVMESLGWFDDSAKSDL